MRQTRPLAGLDLTTWSHTIRAALEQILAAEPVDAILSLPDGGAAAAPQVAGLVPVELGPVELVPPASTARPGLISWMSPGGRWLVWPVPITAEEFAAGMIEHGAPRGFADALTELLETVLDGHNSSLTDGVQAAIGRAPTDFAAFARAAADNHVWDGPQHP